MNQTNQTKPKFFTVKEIAMELDITPDWLHLTLRPYKKMFKAPGNMKNAKRKTRYSQAEKEIILKIWETTPKKRRKKRPKAQIS